MILKVTDAPFDINNIESALVTITKVEMREECDGISDACEFITLSEDTVTLDPVSYTHLTLPTIYTV